MKKKAKWYLIYFIAVNVLNLFAMMLGFEAKKVVIGLLSLLFIVALINGQAFLSGNDVRANFYMNKALNLPPEKRISLLLLILLSLPLFLALAIDMNWVAGDGMFAAL